MINFLSSWVKNLCLALIVVSILEMLLPNNKTKKYVKMVMGLYILFSIIEPFIENSNELKFNVEDLYNQYSVETSAESENVNQKSMDSRLDELYKQKLENDIVQKLDEEGYVVEDCDVKAHISSNDTGIELITIKIKEKKDNSNENDENQSNEKMNIEEKIVNEIQKIQKVEINVSKNQDNSSDESTQSEQQNQNITKNDIKIVKQFLIKEYGVSEKCLRIS
ncbi:stage III sporulation protein AF [Clostridium sp. CAG:389]|nr:stage III sporulation protein AF [Clostridium sp. CAG:389]